jgi:hypothetical protein
VGIDAITRATIIFDSLGVDAQLLVILLCPFDWGSLPEVRINAKQKRKEQYTGALGKNKA